MGFFQDTVVHKYLRTNDANLISQAYAKFGEHFHNPRIQENIRNSKEEQYQGEFLIDLFVKVLGYTKNPNDNFNLTTEYKNIKDSKKADGAILVNGTVKAVIELKGTNTTDLGKVEEQAFGYKNNQPECVYVITSNFEKLRLYIDNAIEHIEFNLFTLNFKEFELLYLCLAFENVEKNIPKKIKDESLSEEDVITKKLYKDYSIFKSELFNNIVTLNPGINPIDLFQKAQKLIDRFLFLFFAEDRSLLPPNSVRLILSDWRDLQDRDEDIGLYDRFKKYFEYLNTGYKGKRYEVFAYNGGLFKLDEILDVIKIDSDLLYKHTLKLSEYNFNSEVDVNILGHIFENSLNELDELKAQSEGEAIDRKKTRRKKDGVFYTPKYITKYIVDNTVGKLCLEKKEEIDIRDEDYVFDKKRPKKITLSLVEKLNQYKAWLLELTICDPACGSGAFLNQALDFLIKEHKYIDELQAKLLGETLVFSDIEKSILEKNLYGVDINEESVEIAKLSLWLRTAQPNRKLNDLNNNIKCGNSIIDDPAVAGDKAFNWQNEFPDILSKGGFDVVIGNPPYGAYFDEKSKIYLPKQFKTFQGNFEIYFFFIEILNKLVKSLGKVGYICPDTWINIPQAQKLREHVLKNYGINTIISFHHSVFSDASVNAIIFILTKDNFYENCEFINVISNNYSIGNLNNTTQCDVSNWKKSKDNQFQIWQNESDIDIIKKIQWNSKLGEDVLDISQGIVPYSKENLTEEQVKQRIYHNSEKLNENFGDWVQGRSLLRYGIDLTNKEYLKYGEWLHRPRKAKYFNGNRILIQEITGGNPPRIKATIFNGLLYHDPGIIACLNKSTFNLEYILAIINSKLISWYNLKTAPKGKRTTFPKLLIGDVRNIPFANTLQEKQIKLSEKVQVILKLNKVLMEISEKFQRNLYRKFKLTEMSKKMQEWHIYSYVDFIKELSKLKIKLTLSEEAEWEEYFNSEKKKALDILAEIEKADKEIDQMVYKLYELTDEEIRIVESSN